MDDLDLHLALEALRTNPAAHAYHERITRGMQAVSYTHLDVYKRQWLHGADELQVRASCSVFHHH